MQPTIFQLVDTLALHFLLLFSCKFGGDYSVAHAALRWASLLAVSRIADFVIFIVSCSIFYS